MNGTALAILRREFATAEQQLTDMKRKLADKQLELRAVEQEYAQILKTYNELDETVNPPLR